MLPMSDLPAASVSLESTPLFLLPLQPGRRRPLARFPPLNLVSSPSQCMHTLPPQRAWYVYDLEHSGQADEEQTESDEDEDVNADTRRREHLCSARL